MNLEQNADLVRQQVETARNKANRQDQVNVIAVTKYVDVATTEALVKTGIQHIGENRVDKFLEKYQALKELSLIHICSTSPMTSTWKTSFPADGT